MESDTLRKLTQIICDRLDVAPEALCEETSLIEDLDADSLDLADLALCIEEVFSIRIPEADVEHLLTLGNALHYLDQRV